jgi:hypothetical protein
VVLLLAIGGWLMANTGVNGPSTGFRMDPHPATTGQPSVIHRVPNEKLIIEQNPSCWLGVPGWVCDGTATYYTGE